MTSDNDRLRELAHASEQPVVPQPVQARTLRPLLVFRVGTRIFGAEASHVYEVVVSDSITPVPTARPYILGVTLVRGRLMPVISLGELLGFQSRDEGAPTLPRLLILRDGPSEVAVMTDATLGLYEVDVTDIGSSTGTRPDCIAGELEFRGELLLLLACSELLRALTSEKGAQ